MAERTRWDTIRDAFPTFLGKKAPEPAAHEPYAARAAMASSAKEPDDDSGWRKATGGLGGDMVGITSDIQNRQQVISIIRRVARKNPFIESDFVEPMTACVIGSGVRIRTENQKLKKILDKFVKRNAFYAKFQYDLYKQTLYEGELILPIRVDRDGAVSVTYLYTDTAYVRFSPDDNRLVDFLSILRLANAAVPEQRNDGQSLVATGDPNAKNERRFTPILDVTDKDELFQKRLNKFVTKPGIAGVDVAPPEEDTRDMCVYCRFNTATTRRGLPKLFRIMDFGDVLDQFTYNHLKMLEAILRLWLDVTVTGGKAEVEKIAQQYKNIPPGGSADVHNETVEVAAKKFEIDGTAVGAGWTTMKDGWDLTTGVPSDYLLGKKEIEAGSMFQRLIVKEQKEFEEPVRILVDCEIAAQKAAGNIGKDEDTDYDILFPEVSTRDVGRLATAINQIALSLMLAKQENWIDGKDAAAVYAEILDMAADTQVEPQDGEPEPGMPPVEGDPNAMPQDGGKKIGPQAGGSQGGQADAFNKFTRRGAKMNRMSKAKVTRA